jgi:hypothetical protein
MVVEISDMGSLVLKSQPVVFLLVTMFLLPTLLIPPLFWSTFVLDFTSCHEGLLFFLPSDFSWPWVRERVGGREEEGGGGWLRGTLWVGTR